MSRAGASRGFGLIELMIAVAIVGILAAIAYPSYQDQVQRSRRGDAIASLMELAQAQERHMAVCGNYADRIDGVATCGDANEGLGRGTDSEEGFYTLAVSNAASGATYTLTATHQGPQVGDTRCKRLSLTHLGVRAAQDADDNAVARETCW